MSMLRSVIPWTIHSPPTLSPQLVRMKGCHKPSTYSSIAQVNIYNMIKLKSVRRRPRHKISKMVKLRSA